MKFYWFIAAFHFFKDKKLKKLIVALKFIYFLTVVKLLSSIFNQFFIFNQMIALQKLRKMFFISSKKLFSLSGY